MKKSRSLTMSICLLCILGLAIIPASAGLKDTLQSDEFDGSKLSEMWSIDNPDIGSFKVGGGKLTVTGGFNGNVWGDSDALFFYQEVSQQNFDITTDFIHDYQGGSTVAGLLVESETTKDTKARDGEWVTLKLWGRGSDDNNAVCNINDVKMILRLTVMLEFGAKMMLTKPTNQMLGKFLFLCG